MHSLVRRVAAICACVAPPAYAQFAADDAGTARDGHVGGWSSIVARNGDAAVSYFCERDTEPAPNGNQYALRFAWRDATGWHWTAVSDRNGGSDSAMARGGDGLYNIVWASWQGVKWARGSAAAWTISPLRVDNNVAQPSRISMALDAQDRPHVAYMSGHPDGDHVLRYTAWNGSGWSRGASEFVAANCWSTAISNSYLALDTAGVPHIAYSTRSDPAGMGPLYYASLAGGVWQSEALGVTAFDASLAIGSDDVPQIVYQSPTGLMYARKPGASWQFETISPGGGSISLALSDSNVPYASLEIGTDVYIAKRGAGGWIVTALDHGAPTVPNMVLGQLGTSIDVDETGLAHVSYMAFESLNGQGGFRSDLRYAASDGNGGPGFCPAVVGSPVSQSACPSGTAVFSVAATGTAIAYRWEAFFPGGGHWVTLTDGANEDNAGSTFAAHGTATATLTITGFSEEPEGPFTDLVPMDVRCVVSNICGSVASNPATLSILDPADPSCTTSCDPDVNCDGSINGFDIEAAEQAVNGDYSNFCQASADLNGDGAENGFDIETEEQRVNGAPC